MAVVVIPGSLFPLLIAFGEANSAIAKNVSLGIFGLTALAAVVLHLVSTIKLGKSRSGWLTVLLLLGGWVVGLVSLFAGCLAFAG